MRPRWIGTAGWFAGMVLLWMGQRALSGGAWSRALCLAGILSVVLAGVAFFLQSRAAQGAERRFRQRMMGLAILGLVALGLWALQSELGEDLLRELGDEAITERIGVVLGVFWPIVWLASALPLLFMELSFGSMSPDAVEGWRLEASGRSALVLVLVLGTLGFANYIASQLDWKRDWSYLRTTRPSESTLRIAENLDESLEVVLFYPPANEVAEALLLYLEELEAASQRVRLSVVEHALAPLLAEKYGVSGDGTVVLARGDAEETLRPGLELSRAKQTLRSLDGEIQQALLKLTSEERVTYLTTGHGERDWTQSEQDEQADRAGLRQLKSLLENLNYRVERLGLSQGLGSEIPGDASMVFVIGPREPFLPAELASLRAYLERGGHLLICADPEHAEKAQPVLEIVGIAMRPNPLANDRYYVRQRSNESDHFFLFSNRYSYHASISTLNRFSDQLAMIFPEVGHLEEIKKAGGPSISFMIRSLPDTWIDLDRNARLNEDGETRGIYNLAAAIEGRASDDDQHDDWRAVAFADADWLADGYLRNPGNAQALADVVSWLQGEEAARVEVEEDVPIVHTREKDVIWFYGTIFAPPLLVLGAGLWGVRRRHSGGRRA
jgi:hypothetical protein